MKRERDAFGVSEEQERDKRDQEKSADDEKSSYIYNWSVGKNDIRDRTTRLPRGILDGKKRNHNTPKKHDRGGEDRDAEFLL